MNKETRSFIWGIIMVFVCGIAVAINIIKIENNGKMEFISYVAFGLQCAGVVSGFIRIFKNID